MDKTIQVEMRRNYGVNSYYVVSDHALDIKVLTNKKTINYMDVQALEGLGFKVVMRANPVVSARDFMVSNR